jgi:hypothetical protein
LWPFGSPFWMASRQCPRPFSTFAFMP